MLSAPNGLALGRQRRRHDAADQHRYEIGEGESAEGGDKRAFQILCPAVEVGRDRSRVDKQRQHNGEPNAHRHGAFAVGAGIGHHRRPAVVGDGIARDPDAEHDKERHRDEPDIVESSDADKSDGDVEYAGDDRHQHVVQMIG
jgi:hypothetical protein